ncbi:MAG TPA: response regulator [Thermoanaerobaculia bacterium]
MAARTTSMPRVLVAEDDPAIRRLLAATLRRRRLDVQLTEDGQQALEALQRERWDVIVMDLMMPVVNGWEVVRWLSAHPEQRPASVIVVSAADREALRELDPTVVNAIVFKPFDVMQLGAYVKSAAQQGQHDRRHARVVKTV